MDQLNNKKCVPCEGNIVALSKKQADDLLQQIKNWQLSSDAKKISRVFEFKNFYRTMSFVNAVAWIANSENHHPDMQVSYNRCLVEFSTHAINGLSENDFICAAKIDKLIAL